MLAVAFAYLKARFSTGKHRLQLGLDLKLFLFNAPLCVRRLEALEVRRHTFGVLSRNKLVDRGLLAAVKQSQHTLLRQPLTPSRRNFKPQPAEPRIHDVVSRLQYGESHNVRHNLTVLGVCQVELEVMDGRERVIYVVIAQAPLQQRVLLLCQQITQLEEATMLHNASKCENKQLYSVSRVKGPILQWE